MEQGLDLVTVKEFNVTLDEVEWCPESTSTADLYKLRTDLEYSVTYEEWLAGTKANIVEQRHSLIKELLVEHTNAMFEANDAVEEALEQYYALEAGYGESMHVFRHELQEQFRDLDLPLIDTGIDMPTILTGKNVPVEVRESQNTLKDFILQLSESLTFRDWLTSKINVSCGEIEQHLSKLVGESTVLIDRLNQ